jgi:hypothetical protein
MVTSALDRIENMRRQLAVNSNSIAQDLESIQTVDLLGEGTFGKVGARRGPAVCLWGVLCDQSVVVYGQTGCWEKGVHKDEVMSSSKEQRKAERYVVVVRVVLCGLAGACRFVPVR